MSVENVKSREREALSFDTDMLVPKSDVLLLVVLQKTCLFELLFHRIMGSKVY